MKTKYASVRSDYAILNTSTHNYYFGYEVLYCPKCNKFFEIGKHECEHEDDYEWAFSATKREKDPSYMRVEDFDYGCELGAVLLECIGRFTRIGL